MEKELLQNDREKMQIVSKGSLCQAENFLFIAGVPESLLKPFAVTHIPILSGGLRSKMALR